jgi:hypothetical protein
MAFGSSQDRANQKEKEKLAQLLLAERVRLGKVKDSERSAHKKQQKERGGYMREMPFIPASKLRKQEARRCLNGSVNDSGDGDNGQKQLSIDLWGTHRPHSVVVESFPLTKLSVAFADVERVTRRHRMNVGNAPRCRRATTTHARCYHHTERERKS